MKKFTVFFASLLLVLGMAVSAMAATTFGNNFTMNTPQGTIQGGTNDVVFTWDGSVHPTLTGVSNATITSNEPFYNWLWYAHDVEIVGPGTYSVDICAKGPGSCGNVGAPVGTYFYEVNVPAGMIGAHMLFDWGRTEFDTYCCKAACDIDMWVVWDANKAYEGQFYAGADNGTLGGDPYSDYSFYCHPTLPVSVLDGMPNTSATVWSLVSVDAAGRLKDAAGTTLVNYPVDGIPGLPMADGAFPNFSANFNFMTVVVDTGCMINGMLIASGATNPANQCQECNTALSRIAWSNRPNGTTCNDGNACTTNDVCANGTCSGTTVTCNMPPDQCHVAGVCDTGSGQCNYPPAPNGTLCSLYYFWNDPSVCHNDYCSNGVCVKGTELQCNDNNVCTTDKCMEATGGGHCVYTANTLPCNDNNACTTNDVCANKVCSGTPIVCNDNNVCTTDSCDPTSGCRYTPKNCDDNNVCTTDTCNPANGKCVHTAIKKCKR